MFMKRICVKMTGFLQRYWREIAYYGCVMLVLGVIAWGAENYRAHRVQAVDVPAVVSSEAVEVREEERFSIPEGMEVSRPFSAQPVWDDVHGCWQAHPAVDFACADGKVQAIGGGKVKTVGESGVYGGFIEIEDGEVLLRYCSVVPDEELQVGAEVERGGFIGTADAGMPGEMHMGAHVHVETMRDGEMADVRALTETSD